MHMNRLAWLLCLSLASLVFPLLAQEEPQEKPQLTQVPESTGETEQVPVVPETENAPRSDPPTRFTPSEEIDADHAVSFPVDI